MAHTIWSGYLAFGMVSIPVKLAAAARNETLAFNMLCAQCKGRIIQKLFCPTCNKEISRADTLKGYEDSKDRYLVVTQAELDQLQPASSTSMEITQFCDAEEVDPIYYDSSYYLEPEKVGRPAYKLLAESMRAAGRMAIAKLCLRQREHTVVIRTQGAGLTLQLMFYEDEVRANDLNLSDVPVVADHLKMARQLIAALTRPFDPREFKDNYLAKVLELLESKRTGAPLVLAPAPAGGAPVIDIAQALALSLAKKPPTAAASASGQLQESGPLAAAVNAPPEPPAPAPGVAVPPEPPKKRTRRRDA